MSRRPDTKLAAYYRSSKDKQAAQASANRFTAKQSQFNRKQEERQVVQNLTGGSTDISRFEQARRRVNAVSLSSAVPAVAAFGAKKKESMFALHDSGSSGGGGASGWGQQDAGGRFKRDRSDAPPSAMSSMSGGGGLLGNAQVSAAADGDDAPSAKKSRFEKFQDVISSSRTARIRDQRERSDREKETDNLDVEFDAVAHLLQKRDKRQEQIDAFAASGTQEVRELLKQFKANRTSGAKVVSFTSSGQLQVISEAPLPSSAAPTGGKALTGAAAAAVAKAAGGAAAAAAPPAAASALDADDKRLLAKLTSGKSLTLTSGTSLTLSTPASSAQQQAANLPNSSSSSAAISAAAKGLTTLAAADDDVDDFDKLLFTMRQETRRATPADRTLSPEEDQRLEARQLELQAQRSAVPFVSGEDPQLTRREWLEQGGDRAHLMGDEDEDDAINGGDMLDLDYDDVASSSDEGEEDGNDGDDNTAGGSTKKTAEDSKKKCILFAGEEDDAAAFAGLHPLDAALVKLEQLCSNSSSSSKSEVSGQQQTELRIAETIDAIHLLCKKHSMHAAQSFRLMFIDMERRTIKGSLPSNYDLIVLLAASRLFPVSDFRHPVATPLLIYLSSTLMQLQLTSPKHWKVAIVLSSILLGCMRQAGGKFCSELVLVPLNLLALQVSRKVLEPVQHRSIRMPCPVLVRPESAVLPDTEATSASVRPIQILSTELPSISQVLMSAIGLFHGAALLYRNNPSFDYCFRDPLAQLVALLDPTAVHPAIRQPLDELQQRIAALSEEAKTGRTPLAMRSFRPRPIRLFDPMLVEAQDPAIKERKELKKELREDRKRVVRHVLAEASVERRAREKEAAAVDAHREGKYKQLMGQLQAQEHIMKTVDNFMVKARSKKRKGVSGDPYKAGGGEGGAGGGAAGGEA